MYVMQRKPQSQHSAANGSPIIINAGVAVFAEGLANPTARPPSNSPCHRFQQNQPCASRPSHPCVYQHRCMLCSGNHSALECRLRRPAAVPSKPTLRHQTAGNKTSGHGGPHPHQHVHCSNPNPSNTHHSTHSTATARKANVNNSSGYRQTKSTTKPHHGGHGSTNQSARPPPATGRVSFGSSSKTTTGNRNAPPARNRK